MNVQGNPLYRRPAGAIRSALLLALFLSQSAVLVAHAAATVVAWGAFDSGQTTIPGGLTNVVAVAGGASHSVALNGNGTVIAWGFNASGQTNVPPGLNNVAAIGAGAVYSLGLQSNGTIVIWGSLPAAPASASNVTAVAAGWYHALALRSDGTVVSWGAQTNVPAWLSNVVAIAAGNGQSMALRLDGSVVAWGDNSYGKTNVPAAASANIVAIAAGGDHCLALQRSGTVLAWGRNTSGQTSVPGTLNNAVAVSGGALHSLALRSDGTLVAWGDNTYGQSSVSPNDPGYIAISAGGYHNLALKGDGTPYILVPPANQTAIISKSTTLQVLATGAQPLLYQWYHYGTNIIGATSSSLSIPNVQARDGGPYTVSVANNYNTVFSQPAILTAVGMIPVITTPPRNTSTICGDGASFSVAADGSTPLTYQWQFGGANIPGATQTSLTLNNVNLTQAGTYYVAVSNAFGGVVTGAVLTVIVQPPRITSALTNVGVQGQPFSYQITALHSPNHFGASYLPSGLTINPTSGLISGIPTETGTFGVLITAMNACSSDTRTLVLTFSSGAPVITSGSTAYGSEGAPFSFQVTASGSPTGYGAQNLPAGLSIDPVAGLISGTPTYAGTSVASISASNIWGVGTQNLTINIANMVVSNLYIGNITYNYSSPFLLDFQFSLFTYLGDPNNTNLPPPATTGVVVDPHLLSAICMEDGVTNSAQEGGLFLVQGSKKVVKIYLVMDFTESIASLANGDLNTNGISDAVDFEVAGSMDFVNQLASDIQMGVVEFHRDDWFPSNVVALTTDKVLLNNSIAGIWTNYVQGFSSGSRCWDALSMAIAGLGTNNVDEQHFVVFVSDGRDESSTNTLASVIKQATNNAVKVFAVGFGDELDAANLMAITDATQGSYYTATTPADIANKLAQITKSTQGQYILRWATLKRSSTPFVPSFAIVYGTNIAFSPANTVTVVVDTNQPPAFTNYITNFVLAQYTPSSNAGPVTVGALRTVVDSEVLPTAIDLRTTYTPRYINKMRIRYVPNWPCTPFLASTNPGDMLAGWTLSHTNDAAGTNYLLLSTTTNGPIPFTAFGPLITFQFQDVLLNPTNAFSFMDVDNTLYTNTGGQSFVLSNQLITVYPVLPHGTPVPWLISAGYPSGPSNVWAAAELADPDGDGMANWKEYRANTNPTNAASKLVVNSVGRLPDGRFQINFTTSTNRTYRVDGSLDLQTWQTVQDNIPGVNTNVTVIDTRYIPGVTAIFYRVAVY